MAFGGFVDVVFVVPIKGGRSGNGGVFTSDVLAGALVGNVFAASMESGKDCDGGVFTSDVAFSSSFKSQSRFSY